MAVKARVAVAGLVAGLGLAVGCGGGADEQLDVLELEALASFVAPGGTFDAEPATGDGEVARVFSYDDSTAASAGRAAAVEVARASGWTLTYEEGEPGDPIFGAKELATGDIRLVIGQVEEGEVTKISIRLEHGPCTRCKPGGQQPPQKQATQSDATKQGPATTQPALPGASDDPLSVPGTILVLPSRPNAWAGGPYVKKIGDTVELDGSGSYDSDGRIVRYEWDIDGDGVFDVSTQRANHRYTFTEAVDGQLTLRVTDDDGRTAVARARVHASNDGDETPPIADNCPTVANHGQSDLDEDGVGDECDPTPFGP